jgi:hypothetical protein
MSESITEKIFDKIMSNRQADVARQRIKNMGWEFHALMRDYSVEMLTPEGMPMYIERDGSVNNGRQSPRNK